MTSSDDPATVTQKRTVIRATKQQQEALRAAYEANGSEAFSPELRQNLSVQLNLPMKWLSDWCSREKKRTRAKNSSVEIHQFKLEAEDTVIPPPPKKIKRTPKKDLTSDSSTPTDPLFKSEDSDSLTFNAAASHHLLYSSGFQQVDREPYPVPSLQSSISQPNSYNTTFAVKLEPSQSPVFRPISPLGAHNYTSDLSDDSIAHLMSPAAPLQYLPVLQDPNVTDSLLDERFVEQDPFQAAMGLVYLYRRGSCW